MKHAASRELYEYWQSVRRGRPAPQRGEIEPSDIRSILADTFILEADGRERFPVRLAGTRLCGLYGREIRGADFLDLWSGDDRNAVATLATAVTTEGAAAVISLEGRNRHGHGVACEVLLLPLRHGGTELDRLLGSCAPLERPYWLGNDPVVEQSLTSLRLIWPDENPSFMRRATDRLPRRPPVPYPDAEPRRRGHLTLIEGGRR